MLTNTLKVVFVIIFLILVILLIIPSQPMRNKPVKVVNELTILDYVKESKPPPLPKPSPPPPPPPSPSMPLTKPAPPVPPSMPLPKPSPPVPPSTRPVPSAPQYLRPLTMLMIILI